MISLLNDASVFHDKDLIRITDGRETVGNDEACSACIIRSKASWISISVRVSIAGGCLVKDQHWWQAQHDTGDQSS